MDESLNNIPYLGPARRAALEAAGITTRSQLVQASVEQLVGVTGMPRTLAERTLLFLHANAAPNGAPPPQASPTPTETPASPLPIEQKPVFDIFPESLMETLPSPPKPEDGTEAVDTRTDLDRAILRLSTALSDTTRNQPPKLSRQFTKLAALLEELPRAVSALKPRQVRALTKQIEALTSRLGDPPATKKAEEKLREFLREERRKIKGTLPPAPAKAKKAKADDKKRK